MKKGVLFLAVLLAAAGVLYGQDLIVLRDGNFIEAKITEISPTEIRYKRFNFLDGPTIVLPARDVLTLRYENGMVEIINPLPPGGAAGAGAGGGQTPGGDLDPSLGPPTVLQTLLNTLPAVTIAGNSLKFQFGGDSWVARLNGRNFSRGTIEFIETAEGGTLTLNQTHIYPGAIGDTAGRIAGLIPGGERVGSVLSAAGNIAEAVGPIESSGSIVLNFRAGPPASLSFVSASGGASGEDGGGGFEEKRAAVRKNWILVEHIAVGAGLRYERMLGEKTSLMLHSYYHWNFLDFDNWNIPQSLGIDFLFRFYPWGGKFFMGTGLGYHYVWNEGRDQGDRKVNYGLVYGGSRTYTVPHSYGYDLNGMGIPLELGWKFDPGRAGRFFLETGISTAFLFGKKTSSSDYYKDTYNYEGDWDTGLFYSVYFGVGGAF